MKVFTRGQREERWRRGYLTLSGRTNCTRMRGGVKDFGCRQWRQLQLKLSELTRLLALLSALAALIKTVSRHKKLITANNFRIKTFQSFLFVFPLSVFSSQFVVLYLFLLCFLRFLVAYSHCRFFRKKGAAVAVAPHQLARGAFCVSASCISCCCCYLKRLRAWWEVVEGRQRRVFYADGLLCCLPDCLFVFLFLLLFLLVFLFCDRCAAVAPIRSRCSFCHTKACLLSITTCCSCCCCRALNGATTGAGFDQPKYWLCTPTTKKGQVAGGEKWRQKQQINQT